MGPSPGRVAFRVACGLIASFALWAPCRLALAADEGDVRSPGLQAAGSIPEPLLFDLSLPLGTPRGQVETNVVVRVPSGGGDVIWVPEIESTAWDGVAFELEVDFRGSRQTGFTVASQVTLGTAARGQFIHGVQARVERDDDDKTTELLALWVPGYRFSRVWSAVGMVGLRVPLDGGKTQLVFDATVFAEVGARVVLGLEANYRADDRRSESLNLVPQAHLRLGTHFSLQGGVGLFLGNDSARTEVILRVIYGF